MIDNIYTLETSLLSIENVENIKLNTSDLAQFFIQSHSTDDSKEPITKEQVEEKILRKGFKEQLRLLDINTNINKMSIAEKHDYLKLLYFLCCKSFIPQKRHTGAHKEKNFFSILVWMQKRRAYVGTAYNANNYIEYQNLVNELEIGVRNQSMKSNFNNIDDFLMEFNFLENFQLCLKALEWGLKMDLYCGYDRLFNYQSFIASILDIDKPQYTIMEQMYIHFKLEDIRAIYENKKISESYIESFLKTHDIVKIPISVILQFRGMYYCNKHEKVCSFEQYQTMINNYYENNVDLIYHLIHEIDNKCTKKKLENSKNMIINMVLATIENVSTNFDVICIPELLIPAAFAVMVHFNKKDKNERERIIDMKISDETPLYNSQNSRLTEALKNYTYHNYSACHCGIISSILDYITKLFLGNCTVAQKSNNIEIYISELLIGICKEKNLELLKRLHQKTYEFIKSSGYIEDNN